jgi:hypothetical protein
LRDQIKEDEMSEREMPTECWWRNVRERDHLEDLGIEGY